MKILKTLFWEARQRMAGRLPRRLGPPSLALMSFFILRGALNLNEFSTSDWIRDLLIFLAAYGLMWMLWENFLKVRPMSIIFRYFSTVEVLDAWRPFFKPHPRILEVGSGVQGLGHLISYPFWGADVHFDKYINPNMIPVLMSGSELPFRDNEFDVVISLDTLEHIKNSDLRKKAVQNMWRVTKKALILGYPAGQNAYNADVELSQYYRQRKLQVPEWLEEHLGNGFPPEDFIATELKNNDQTVLIPNESLSFRNWLVKCEAERLWFYVSFFTLFFTFPIFQFVWRHMKKSIHPYRRIYVLTKDKNLMAALKPLILSFVFGFFILGQACATEDARESTRPYGVLEFLDYNHIWNNFHYDSPQKIEKALTLMEEAGVDIVRITLERSDIELEPGKFGFEKYDRLIERIQRHHIKILGVLAFNDATWSDKWNAPPDANSYLLYAEATVSRYKDKIKYWEIWNEPDLTMFWSKQDNMVGYTNLLKLVYPALKKEDPTCVILSGGLAQLPFSLKRIYKNGGQNFFDVVSIHPYVNPLLPQSLNRLENIYKSVYRVMEENKDEGKPIWFTEISCPGVPASKSKGWWLGKSPNENQQAVWAEAVYGEPLKWKGISKIFWAEFRDTNDSFHNDIDNFGLLYNNFSKKPAFSSFKKMTHQAVGH